jgi:hypothetical protein
MAQIVDYLMIVQNRIAIIGDEAEKNGRITADYNAFNMTFNVVRITAEAIDYYDRDWSNHTATFSTEKTQRTYEEFVQRIGELLKFCLIRTLSYIEYAAKEKIRRSNILALVEIKKAIEEGKRVNLAWIVNSSFKHGLIDSDTQKKWEGLNELRNCIVHNGGFADFAGSYIVDGFEIEFRKGENLRFELNVFISLIDSAIRVFELWLVKVSATAS